MGESAASPAPPAPPAAALPVTLDQRLTECVALVRKASAAHDDTLLLRALRKTTLIRKNEAFSSGELVRAVKKHLPAKRTPSAVLDAILSVFSNEMEVVDESAAATTTTSHATTTGGGELVPDVELYLHHTALHFAKTRKTCTSAALSSSAAVMMHRLSTVHATTTLAVLRARAVHTFAIIAESSPSNLQEQVLQAHRVACLSGEVALQAVTFNLVLRHLVLTNQIAEADKFASKARFPLDQVGNNAQIRYLYYMGRIQALQLDYSAALASLLHAIRKLPTPTSSSSTSSTTSAATPFLGLRLKLHKLATVVTLLTGELPERAWFSAGGDMHDALLAYFDLVKSVREGQLHSFERVLQANRSTYAQDGVLSLVQRLHSSVIKTGLKSIGVSYSRISFQDVASKLNLETTGGGEEALYLCAKAIRDGVLDASWIDDAEDCLCSAEPTDVYATTTEPSEAFQRRITYLVQAHNDAVKSMRFPAHKSSNPVGKEGATFEFDEDELEELADSHMDED